MSRRHRKRISENASEERRIWAEMITSEPTAPRQRVIGNRQVPRHSNSARPSLRSGGGGGGGVGKNKRFKGLPSLKFTHSNSVATTLKEEAVGDGATAEKKEGILPTEGEIPSPMVVTPRSRSRRLSRQSPDSTNASPPSPTFKRVVGRKRGGRANRDGVSGSGNGRGRHIREGGEVGGGSGDGGRLQPQAQTNLVTPPSLAQAAGAVATGSNHASKVSSSPSQASLSSPEIASAWGPSTGYGPDGQPNAPAADTEPQSPSLLAGDAPGSQQVLFGSPSHHQHSIDDTPPNHVGDDGSGCGCGGDGDSALTVPPTPVLTVPSTPQHDTREGSASKAATQPRPVTASVPITTTQNDTSSNNCGSEGLEEGASGEEEKAGSGKEQQADDIETCSPASPLVVYANSLAGKSTRETPPPEGVLTEQSPSGTALLSESVTSPVLCPSSYPLSLEQAPGASVLQSPAVATLGSLDDMVTIEPSLGPGTCTLATAPMTDTQGLGGSMMAGDTQLYEAAELVSQAARTGTEKAPAPAVAAASAAASALEMTTTPATSLQPLLSKLCSPVQLPGPIGHDNPLILSDHVLLHKDSPVALATARAPMNDATVLCVLTPYWCTVWVLSDENADTKNIDCRPLIHASCRLRSETGGEGTCKHIVLTPSGLIVVGYSGGDSSGSPCGLLFYTRDLVQVHTLSGGNNPGATSTGGTLTGLDRPSGSSDYFVCMRFNNTLGTTWAVLRDGSNGHILGVLDSVPCTSQDDALKSLAVVEGCSGEGGGVNVQQDWRFLVGVVAGCAVVWNAATGYVTNRISLQFHPALELKGPFCCLRCEQSIDGTFTLQLSCSSSKDSGAIGCVVRANNRIDCSSVSSSSYSGSGRGEDGKGIGKGVGDYLLAECKTIFWPPPQLFTSFAVPICPSFAGQGYHVAGAEQGTLLMWDLEGMPIGCACAGKESVIDMASCVVSRHLFCLGADGNVFVYKSLKPF